MSGRDLTPLRRIGFGATMALCRVVLAVTARMSDAALIRAAGRIGRLLAHFPPARKRIERNLDLIRPDMPAPARAALAAEVGASLCMNGAEYMRMRGLAADPSLATVEGAEHVETAIAAGRPIIYVTAHFGCWEFIRIASRRLGRESAIIYRAFNNPGFDALAQGLIREAGEPVMHKGRQGSRALLRHVMKGGAALILVDQRQTGSPLLPFMGHPAETATAAAELAKRFDAALIPARALRLRPGEAYAVRFEAPVDCADPEAAMAEVNARIAAWVDEAPGQWFWLHRRWKLRPRGERIRAAAEGRGKAG